MDSTDTAATEQVSAFFARLVAAAEAMRAAGGGIPLAPDSTATSYYNVRSPAQPLVFEEAACVDLRSLERIWTEGGRPELLQLIPHLEELRAKLRARPDAEGEVSPLIYAMF